jgi:putative oxidoreductase
MKKVCALTQMLCQGLEKLKWFPPLLTRLSIGAIFVEAGWGKLHNLEKVVAFFTELGIPAPQLQAPFVAGTEFICGALLLLGLVTRLASIPLIISMIVAIVTAKKGDINSVTDLFNLSEYLFIVGLIWLIFYGAGCISVDNWLGKKFCKSEDPNSKI